MIRIPFRLTASPARLVPEQIAQQISNAVDARLRAQAVGRMIRYSTRMPTQMRHEASTGQLRQPPRIAGAVEPASGLFHAFAIYEMRSGDVAAGGRFHVYVTDLLSMRSLLPLQTCWRQSTAALLISLLHTKSEAEQEVVVLRCLTDENEDEGGGGGGAARLESYYSRLGFTSEQAEFERAGLSDSYRKGDLLYM
jgi:hypothetical protein